MSTASRNFVRVLLAGAGAWGSAAHAAVPNIPETEGWRGYVAIGAGYLDLESNTISGSKIIDLDNDRLDNITDSPDGRDTALPAILGELTYTFANQNQLFIGTSVEDAVTLDGGARLGWRKGTDSLGNFEVAVVSSLPAAPLEVYEDPFETNKKREKTDRTYAGLRFDWDRILSTGFGFQLEARSMEVDKERSCLGTNGDSPNIACNGIDSSLLERDADEVGAKVYYTFDIGERHQLRPIVAFADHDADGDAQDFEATRVQLTYAYRGDNVTSVANFTWGDLDYDTNNPLYGRERDSDTYGIDATVFYRLPWDGWSAFLNGLYGEVDSDINFYDLEVRRVVAGAQYRFGGQP